MDETILKPFHESIVDALNACGHIKEHNVLLSLLETTKIPKGHGTIISALSGNDKLFSDNPLIHPDIREKSHKRVGAVIELLKEQQTQVLEVTPT